MMQGNNPVDLMVVTRIYDYSSDLEKLKYLHRLLHLEIPCFYPNKDRFRRAFVFS